MISVTSVTDQYILQPILFEKHQSTTNWISSTLLWKRELKFFQKLLDQYAPRCTSIEQKQQVDHFQSIITYYDGELVDTYKSQLRRHERHLAEALNKHNESDTRYVKEHDALMNEMQAVETQLTIYKQEFYEFIETLM
jgi:hypothetical protein